jgi:AraC-like DNA-binding protein
MEKREYLQQDTPDSSQSDVLSRERMESVCRTAIQYIETGKCYLSLNFCMWELVRETGISSKIISASINRYIGRNFYEFINRIHTEEAMLLLREVAAGGAKVNVDDIGARSGFTSRNVFFARFREYEGMTPGKWMSIHRSGDTDMENLKRKRYGSKGNNSFLYYSFSSSSGLGQCRQPLSARYGRLAPSRGNFIAVT